MKTLDLVGKGGEAGRAEFTAMKHRAGVTDQSGHVPYQLVRGANLVSRLEIREIQWRTAQCLLRSIRERSEKMLKQSS
jgi:hypothetical protein